MDILANCKPQDVFRYFKEICGIPRGSGNTDAIASYLTEFAEKRGLSWDRDEANNIVIRKPASEGYGDAQTLILQGHHDMVCEKEYDVDFDFTKDGIILQLDGDTLHAKGTTLGGDNGIAVAMMLALLDDDMLMNPPLEILITSDEEIGLLGAFAFDCSKLEGKRLINLDSEEEGVIMCSCAGGVNARSRVPVDREVFEGTVIEININDLEGGHSGVEIDKGRANANILMGRLLHDLKIPFRIAELGGGGRETAIAVSAFAKITTTAENVEKITDAVKALSEVYKREYISTEPCMNIKVVVGSSEKLDALDEESTELVCSLLMALPDGVQAMSADMPGLVQTSTNMGVLELKENELYFVNTVRSSMRTQKQWVFDKIAAMVEQARGVTEAEGDYPGWAYNPQSPLKDTVSECYRQISGRQAAVEAVHAGIECGIFADRIPGLDCVSIGPDMGDVHTPREHLSVSSVERTYSLLKKVLENCI